MIGFAFAAALLFLAPSFDHDPLPGYDIERMVLLYSTLPRLATALIAGAALALSGALFQQVLRNPLASPTTLGISAGANLALVLVTLYIPDLMGLGRDVVALAGSAIAAGIVLAIGSKRGFSPFSLVLSGLVISLWCGSLAAILTLLNDRYLASLFIWGAGSLAQQSWVMPLSLLIKTGLIGLASLMLIRPLALLDLGDSGAQALGLGTIKIRLIAVTLAVALAAFVTSAVGVIGFIGLVAPTLCRLAGARRPGELMVGSALLGAALLLIADLGVQSLAGTFADQLPTGAVTAVFGSPLLLLLLPRLKMRHRPSPAPVIATEVPRRETGRLLILLACLAAAIAIGLFLGRDLDGSWVLALGEETRDLLALRLPKVTAVIAAGAMLAVAGVILQRLTGNEMASPEVLGVSSGATLGLAAALFLLAAPATSLIGTAFAIAGAFAVLLVIFLFSTRSGFAAERVLLGGIALGAMVDAIIGMLSATGDPRAFLLMRWMSGSSYAIGIPSALTALLFGICLVAMALLVRRWLDLLPLGPVTASALGVPMAPARLMLFSLAGAMSAVAALTVGPLSFIGLMGPHLAREAGFRHALPQMAGAAAIGASLMVLADWIGRTAAFPYQVPAGLVSALVGAPILMLMLSRR
ncbi:Fe(3+)-hydroxamate ABC transporter permease FhuB [Rhizobium alvei]